MDVRSPHVDLHAFPRWWIIHARMARRLMSLGEQCPFGCAYCFADFTQYQPPPTLGEVAAEVPLPVSVTALYPGCDADLFASSRWEAELLRCWSLRRSISVATKASLSRRQLAAVSRLAAEMRGEGAVLKIAVSISTKRRVPEIEPGASTYEQRLETLRRLGHAGLVTSALLRPLLADVCTEEYEEILRDVAPVTHYVVFGDEYLDADPKRRRGSLQVDETARSAAWLEGSPSWPISCVVGRIPRLHRYARALDLNSFDSDLDLMEMCMREQRADARRHGRS